MSQKIPVGMLLRVSTTMQVTAQQEKEADIPTQRTACLRFIGMHPDWELVKEYVEIGVSGHKVSINDRDKLLEAQEDIRTGVIKVMVVFMFDRLGRIEAETPFVVQNFVTMGAEVWSVREGQRKFESHADNLLNYITFWQADGESKKTSQRVSNAMTIMAEQGLYTGGRAPYGYKVVETGRFTKKQLPEKTLAINEEEAKIVRRAFRLALNSGYGCHRIAKALNESGLRNRNGNQWSHSSISNMLRNPIYKGLKAYNRTTGKGMGKGQKRLPPERWTLAAQPNPNWMIVSPEDWEVVNNQKRLAVGRQRTQQSYNESLLDTVVSRSKLLFGGFAYCGICGAKMNTGYSPYRWTTKDGVTHRVDNPVYRCGTRSSGKIGCTAKSSYQRRKVEDVVLAELRGYLDRMKRVDLSLDIGKLQHKTIETEEKAVKYLKKELAKTQQELLHLEKEILKVIAGESPLPRDTLSTLLEKKKAYQKKLVGDIRNAEDVLGEKKKEQANLAVLQEVIPVWSEVFDSATVDEQKVMLSRIIKRVDIYPDSIEVHLRFHVQEFIGLSHSGIE